MPCLHSALQSAGRSVMLFVLPAFFAALIVFVLRQIRSRRAAAALPLDDTEALLQKGPVSSEVELVDEKAALALSSEEWMPPNHFDGSSWMTRVLAQADESTEELHPVLKQFKSTIEDDPILYMLFTRMFTETPEATDPTGRPQVRDYKHMLAAFNVVLSMGPPWVYTTAGEKGAIGAPITAILNWVSAGNTLIHPSI